MRCRVDVYGDSVSVTDEAVRPKCSEAAYDRFRPTHIPDVTIQMTLTPDAELFAISLPLNLTNHIPALAGCHQPGRRTAIPPTPQSYSRSGIAHFDNVASLVEASAVSQGTMSATVDLPSNTWALLGVLKILGEGQHVVNYMFGHEEGEEPCSAGDVLEVWSPWCSMGWYVNVTVNNLLAMYVAVRDKAFTMRVPIPCL